MSKITKAVVLAGGLGTRLSEETDLRPKPLVEIGGYPILWHILKIYHNHGISDFIICIGYKGYLVKEYFQNYFLHSSDVTFDFEDNTTTIHNRRSEDWKITLVDTGQDTMTGGRIKKIQPYIVDEDFFMTYGDGVSNVDISALGEFHSSHGRKATVTTVSPPGRFGRVAVDGDMVKGFEEKPKGEVGWINGGFFVLSSDIFDYIDGPQTVWEHGPMERLAADRQLAARPHDGFWWPMDTLRDKNHLEHLWKSGDAPWRIWNQSPIRSNTTSK